VTAFRAEKPSSQFETLLIEIQLVKELWNETLQKLGERMARQEGQKPADIFDVPNEIRKTIDRVVSESPTAAEITALMRKLGVSAKFIGMAEHTLFRDSLTGQSWSEIARLPGVGILSPGTIEIELKAPKPSPAEVPKAK
jgi:hypothetical protein